MNQNEMRFEIEGENCVTIRMSSTGRISLSDITAATLGDIQDSVDTDQWEHQRTFPDKDEASSEQWAGSKPGTEAYCKTWSGSEQVVSYFKTVVCLSVIFRILLFGIDQQNSKV